MKNLSKDKDGLMVSNASLAEYNLSLEPKLITARQQLADVYVKAIELQKQHERNAMCLGNCRAAFVMCSLPLDRGCFTKLNSGDLSSISQAGRTDVS